MKAILVLDVPDYIDFNLCKTVDVGLCFNVKEYTEPFIKSNVPLKPMPEKVVVDMSESHEAYYQIGWNACIEELEK